MFVSSYQIHNVLNVYSKQLSKGRSSQKKNPETKKPVSDQINLSAEGKRRATIERVAEDILNKIYSYSRSGKIKPNPNGLPREKIKKHTELDGKKETEFVFNSIDVLNRKTKTALSVKDTNFLMGRPEESAQDTVEKDSDGSAGI
jgi:hypothetical protein